MKNMMKPIVHKATGFQDADAWDIAQHIQMTPEERQKAAKELRDRCYGKNAPDVRDKIKSK
jgi:cytochrome c